MDPAITGLIGAGIGAGTTVAVTWLQSHYLAKRERARAVMEIALAHRREAFEYAELVPGKITIPPPAIHMHYHHRIMSLIEDNKLTPEELLKLSEEQTALIKVMKSANKAS